MTGDRIRASRSTGPDRTMAKRSALASARVFGTSSANRIVNSARMTVTTTSARVFALSSLKPAPARSPASWSLRLTAA